MKIWKNDDREKERKRKSYEKIKERMTNVKETKTVCGANFFPFFD